MPLCIFMFKHLTVFLAITIFENKAQQATYCWLNMYTFYTVMFDLSMLTVFFYLYVL